MFDCVSIGDATMDVYLTIRDAEVKCKLRDEDCVICLPYGDKVPVDRMDRGLGGNAMNNVVGLSRLGFRVAFFSAHGDDEIGKLMDRTLDEEGVDRSLVVSHANTQSRYSTIINFRGERTILEYQVPHRYRIPHDFPATKWVYVSSVGKDYEDFFGALATLVREKNLKLVFNPNNNQLHSDMATYEVLVQNCELMFMNKEEALRVTSGQAGKVLAKSADYSLQTTAHIKDMLSEIYEIGAKVVVITDGKRGSYAYDGDKYYLLGTLDWPIVSPTGAGDAYATGFMAASMKGLPTVEAMRWGAISAGSVMGEFGPQTGLLKLEKMENLLAENKNFVPEEI